MTLGLPAKVKDCKTKAVQKRKNIYFMRWGLGVEIKRLEIIYFFQIKPGGRKIFISRSLSNLGPALDRPFATIFL